jgi:hypothetical protein
MSGIEQLELSTTLQSLEKRLDAYAWAEIGEHLQVRGYAVLKELLSPLESRLVALLYTESERFRSRVVMERHGYGRGEYQYFAYPLPALIAALRSALYTRLYVVANGWQQALNNALRYPATHAEFLQQCWQAGQTRPTPLLLQYGAGDYNCLHQDLYGEQVFPLQAAILLSQPHEDFSGGELVLTEQRPRMQSRPQVVPLQQGDAVVFAVNQRPVRGNRGVYRVAMRHGVSEVRAGRRMTLGIIFHDAA